MMRHVIRTLVIGVAALFLCIAAPWINSSSATMIIGDPIPLSSLVADPEATVEVEDKLFSSFTYLATGDMPGANGVNVVPIQDDEGNYGLRFQGAFLDLASSQGGSDALITYMVEVTDPRFLISDAHIEGNPNLLGETGSISVTETFLPLGGEGEYTMEIFDDESRPVPKLVDWTYFTPPVKKLNVQKDILAIVTENSESATLSFVDQTFSQVEIPEPATAALLLGGVALGLALRRKTRN